MERQTNRTALQRCFALILQKIRCSTFAKILCFTFEEIIFSTFAEILFSTVAEFFCKDDLLYGTYKSLVNCITLVSHAEFCEKFVLKVKRERFL